MATFNPRTKHPSATFLAKAWLWDDGRIHIVGADPDLPNNGIHINVRSGTSTDANLRQMLRDLDPSTRQLQEKIETLTPEQKAKLLSQLEEQDDE
ncbi:hypothetical protein [Pseudonocardia sp. MH-G8]|uniref:hypothetical protein n=1 Tax=Pseudonocardia sp. MH-G8 TaxID=1854588 RepID=UPI000BA0ED1C|nr:hypothetical protein [Pseudonocardia sp. MH-G8]OZM77815.1 hypothetical protein CFP66_34210 [Pseudonocardia sp. MH-G8]